MRALALSCVGVLLLAGLMAAPVMAQPQRIVSLDYCADSMCWAWPAAIRSLALSPRLPRSDYASSGPTRPRAIPVLRPDAEAVLAARPNLVVRSWGGGRTVDGAVLERLGIDVYQIGYVAGFDDVRREVRAPVSRTPSERPETGEAVLARMDAALESV